MDEVKEAGQDSANVQRSWPVVVAECNVPDQDLAFRNAELRRVNEEVADQNRQLRRRNDEVLNLLHSTEIPIVCVDKFLTIRAMTSAAEYPFSLRAADVGRPITDFHPRFDGLDFKTLLGRVIREAICAEAELIDHDGRLRRLRVSPCRDGNRVDGATLVLIDLRGPGDSSVDSMIESTAESMAELMIKSMVESIPGIVIVLDEQLRVKLASRDFLIENGLLISGIVQRRLEEIPRDPFRSPDLRRALTRLLLGRSDAEEIELRYHSPGQGERAARVTLRPLQLAEERYFIVAINDVTAQHRARKVWATALLDTEDALRISHQELRALAGRLLHSQDEERRRLSRELHDDLSQNVTALQFDIEALMKTLPSTVECGKEKLNAIRNSAGQLANDLRRIAHGLHPATIEVLGLAGAVRAYVEEFSQRSGIEVGLSVSDVPSKIAPELAGSFYRIVQEALRNIAKHASGSAVEIRLAGDQSRLILSIRDKGPGFDRDAVRGRGGLGLVSMEERARLVNARFQLDTSPGHGVSITVSAPLV